MAYKNRKLTAAEQAHPQHVLELLAVVHALRVFCLAAALPVLRGSFRTSRSNQAGSWVRTKRGINRFLAGWLDEVEELPGVPLRRGARPGPA